jgi:hypothetical protein
MPRRGERAEDEWRCYSDGLGELLVFCPECADREFAPDPAPSTDRLPERE